MLSEILGSCAAVMAHSVIVCDCVDTPCWAEDITTTRRASSPPATNVPYPIPHPSRPQHTEVNETLKALLPDVYHSSKHKYRHKRDSKPKNNILNPIAVYIRSLTRLCAHSRERV